MKKLLALILCVMMFVAVIPTAAFAAGTTGGVVNGIPEERNPKYVDLAVAKKAIKDLNDDMKALYTAYATDEVVFGSAKTIYDLTNGMAKQLLKDTESVKFADGTKIYQEDLIANVRKGLNHIIGNEITNYMNERIDTFTNTAGNVQPEKYLNTYVKALNNALTSEKAQKNIEALVYGLATLSLQQSMNDKADDLYADIKAWDHWNEFNWYDIAKLDPSVDANGGYTGTWLPAYTTLIPTGSEAAAADAVDAALMLHGDYSNN